jgi:hypothetical protein
MFEKSNTFRRFARSLTLKVKNTQSRKNEKSKSVDFLRTKITRKHRKVEYFLTCCEKFCDFRAVRLPARGALRNSKQFLFPESESARTGQVQRFFGLTDTCGSDAQSPDWDELVEVMSFDVAVNACYPRCQGATTMCAKAFRQKFVLDLEQ